MECNNVACASFVRELSTGKLFVSFLISIFLPSLSLSLSFLSSFTVRGAEGRKPLRKKKAREKNDGFIGALCSINGSPFV